MSLKANKNTVLRNQRPLCLGIILVIALHLFAFPLAAESSFGKTDYSKIDAYVRSCGANCGKTPKEAAAKVTKICKTDIEKARAIFDWISYNISYDISLSKTLPQAEATFKKRRGVCAHYSNLFTAMAKSVGLDVIEITGMAKQSSSYTPKKEYDSNHAWNAVTLRDDDRTILLDCTWGSGFSNGKTFNRDFSPEWFDTPPSVMIFTHCPDFVFYQLLEPLADTETFLSLPFVPPSLSYCGLDADELYKNFLEHPEQNCVQTFADKHLFFSHDVTINELPVSRSLKKGKDYTFSFSNVPQGIRLSVESVSYSPDEDGNISFTRSFTKTGSIVIYCNGKGLLEYNVMEKPSAKPFSARSPAKDTLPHAVGLPKITKSMLRLIKDDTNPNGGFYIHSHEAMTSSGYVEIFKTSIEALATINKMSLKDGFSEYYRIEGNTFSENKDTVGYRLPTVEEWNLLADRALKEIGTDLESIYEYAYIEGNSGRFYHYPAQKKADVNGLYDLFGNADELCADGGDLYVAGEHALSPVSLITERAPIQKIEDISDLTYSTFRAVLNLPETADGIYEEGNLYYNGVLIEKDLDCAKTLYSRAAGLDHTASIYMLGQIESRSDDEKNPTYEKGFPYYQKAASLGHAESAYTVALCYEFGTGEIEKNPDMAFYWMKKSADSGFLHATYLLADYYKKGFGTAPNPEKYFETMLYLASLKYEDSLFFVGECYMNGYGVEKDEKLAADYYHKSSDTGSINGSLKIAEMFEKEIARSQSWYSASIFYQRAASKGDPYARWKTAQIMLENRENEGFSSGILKVIESYFQEIIASYNEKERDEFLTMVESEYNLFSQAKEKLPLLTKNRKDFLGGIPQDNNFSHYVLQIADIRDATKKTLGATLDDWIILSPIGGEALQNKVAEPISLIQANGELGNGFGRILIVIKGESNEKNKFVTEIEKNSKLASKKQKMHKEYYNFEQSIFEYYDALFFVPAKKKDFALEFLLSRIPPSSQVDIMMVNEKLFPSAVSGTSGKSQKATQKYYDSLKSFYTEQIKNGLRPRFILLGDNTDSAQRDLESLLKSDNDDVRGKISVFGTPLSMNGEIAFGFRKGNLLLCLVSSLGNGKYARIYIDETGAKSGGNMAESFIIPQSSLKDLKSLAVGKKKTIRKSGMTMAITVVK